MADAEGKGPNRPAGSIMGRLRAGVWSVKHGLLLRAWYPHTAPRRRGNPGKWDDAYAGLDRERLYGDETTYRMAADFLADVELVEDWGCGSGGFRRFCRTGYVGVDGSRSPFADRVVDLREYTSTAEGILLRHVLEHDPEWEKILANAVGSFRKKLCIVLFTPFVRRTRLVGYDPVMDLVDIGFRRDDIIRHLSGTSWTLEENIRTESAYKVEHVFFVRR